MEDASAVTTAVSWSLVMVPASTSGSSASANRALMSAGWPPAGPVAACVVAAPDESPQAAIPSPATVAAARISAATATTTIGLLISHLFIDCSCADECGRRGLAGAERGLNGG